MSNCMFRLMVLFYKIAGREKRAPAVLKQIDIVKGEKILDYGCGPGTYSFSASDMVGQDGLIYCADIQPVAVDMIKKRAEKGGIRNIKTIVTSCETGLSENSIDKVFLFDVYHNFQDPAANLKELFRVIKQNGTLAIIIDHQDSDVVIREIESLSEFKFSEKRPGVILMKCP